MKDGGRQTGKRGRARGRRLWNVRLAAVSTLCALLVFAASMGASGIFPFGSADTRGDEPLPAIADTADATDASGRDVRDTTRSADGAASDGAQASAEGMQDAGGVEGAGRGASDAVAAAPDAQGAKPGLPGGREDRQSKPARTPDGADVPEAAVPEVTSEHVSDEVLVTFAEGCTADELAASIGSSGCTLAQPITDEDVAAGFATLKVADGYDVAHAMTQLGMLPEVQAAQPNFVYRMHSGEGQPTTGAAGGFDARTPDGPGARTPDGLGAAPAAADLKASSLDPKAAAQWMLDSVRANEAWDVVQANHAVTVAVLDNGFLVGHEDLKNNILKDGDGQVVAFNAVSGSPGFATSDVGPLYGTDGFSHGTHVAGIIAAEADNGVGVAGVSHNALILPIQVFQADEDDPTDSHADSADLVRGYAFILQRAAEYNVRVVNMSLGGEGELDEDDRAVLGKIEQAYESGILTVCSAGNGATCRGAYESFPCDSAEHAIGVIALRDDEYQDAPSRADWSNYNQPGQTTKALAAPGCDILSTTASWTGSYGYMSGTSMAAPCVAGVAALVYAALGDDATADKVADILQASADDLGDAGWDDEYGFGEVNAYEAVVNATEGIHMAGKRTLLVGDEARFTIDSPGEWEWSSSDEDVATVSGDGVVRGVGVGDAASKGEAVISATCGEEVLSRTVKVYDIAIEGPDEVEFGSFVELSFTSNPNEGRWYVTSSNKDVALCVFGSEGGKAKLGGIYAVGAGKATITVALASNRDVSASLEVTVTRKPLDTTAIVWPASSELAYTGGDVKLKPERITFHHDNVAADFQLVEGRDYTLSYRDNVECGTGTAEVTVTGTGNFYGSASRRYSIVRADIASAAVSGVSAGYVYTGGRIAPAPTVRMAGRTLAAGTDYTVAYADNVKAGTATITMTGKGNYTGSVRKSFEVKKAKVAVPTPVAKLVYSGSRQVGVKATAGCKLSGTASATAAGTYTATATLRDPENHQWVDATSAAKAVTWKIAPTSLAKAGVSGVAASAYYTGKAVKPAPTVKLGKKTLVRNVDYTVSYTGNVKVGTATLVVTGKGNYSGSVKRTFKIVKRANPLSVAAAARSVREASLAKAAANVSPLTVGSARGGLSYAKKGGAACLSVNGKTGKVTVRKGTRAGTYKASIAVTAAGDAFYLAKTRTVSITVKVVR